MRTSARNTLGSGLVKGLLFRRATVAFAGVPSAFVLMCLSSGMASAQLHEIRSNSPAGNKIHFFPAGFPPIGASPTLSEPKTTAAAVTSGPKPLNVTTSNMVYGGGPVMRNPSDYLIFWQPPGASAFPAGYVSGIQAFFQKVGATPFYNIVTQYNDTSGNPVPNSSSLNGTWTDTTTAAPSGCNGDPGLVGSTPNCPLTDADIQNEVSQAISANGWPKDNLNVEYFVFTPPGTDECDGTDKDGNASCFAISPAPPAADKLNGDYCAYHSFFNSQTIYAFVPFGAQGNCYPANFIQATGYPNGVNVDIALSSASHEKFESNTDPLINGWKGPGGNDDEIGDKCAYQYGFVAPDGTTLVLTGQRFKMQWEWSNAANGCAKRLNPPADNLNIPTIVNFGVVPDGSLNSLNLNITDNSAVGTGDANVLYVRLGAGSDPAFGFSSLPQTWATLHASNTFVVGVSFDPGGPPRSAAGTIVVDSDETPCTAGNQSCTTATGETTSNEIVNNLQAVVVDPLTLTKAFGALSVPVGGTTSLTFTITNPNTVSITGVAFSDTLPPGVGTASLASSSGCSGGSVTLSSTSISLTGTTVPTTGCTISLTVQGTTPGIKTNTTSSITSSQTTPGLAAVATLTVIAPPSISKSFVPNKFLPGSTTTVSFTITNPDGFATLLGVAFSDTLPTGLVAATPADLTSNCGGVAFAGAGSISLTGGSIAASGTCTVTATVTAPEGIYDNSVQVTSSNGGTGNTAIARVFVATPPNLSKVFSEVAITPMSPVTLTFALANPNKIVTLNALAFSDTLPSGLVISTPNGLTGSCGGGTIVAPAGNNLITLAGASLAAGASCTFSVSVSSDGSVVGYVTNTTSTVTSTEALPGAPASAVLFIGQPFQVNYSANLNFGESWVDIGNAGTNGAPLLGPGFGGAAGNICVNVYAFDPSEELISCCSCLVTPGQTVSLGVNADLTSKTLTGVVPTSVTIKLLSTLAGGTGTATSCNNSAATADAALANGTTAFRTTLHATPGSGSYATTETQFTPATLSAGELASITGRCASIIGNASGFGICNSCRTGALGGSKL